MKAFPLCILQWLSLNLTVTFTLEFIFISVKWVSRPTSRSQHNPSCYKVE